MCGEVVDTKLINWIFTSDWSIDIDITMPILNTPKSVRIKYSKHGKDGQQAQAYRFKRFFRAYFGSALKVRPSHVSTFVVDCSVLNENPQTHRSNWIRMTDMGVYSVWKILHLLRYSISTVPEVAARVRRAFWHILRATERWRDCVRSWRIEVSVHLMVILGVWLHRMICVKYLFVA